MTTAPENLRILIVDDNEAIHRDFEKILAAPRRAGSQLEELEAELFDVDVDAPISAVFELTFASQGAEALKRVIDAKQRGAPYALAFVDMRMPPGWDGLATIERIWEVDPSIQIVICSAFSDYTWADLSRRLGRRDSLLIVRKPFDTIEIIQCAHAMTTKWALAENLRAHVDNLEGTVAIRTAELVRANALLAQEIRERDRVEEELRMSERLKAIGQLAAGIAHEISTPIQYVSDNLLFLRSGFEQVIARTELLRHNESARLTVEDGEEIDFLIEQVPPALDTIEEGVGRVTRIVSSMREFAHPGSGGAALADINRALANTLTISAHSYALTADVVTDFGALPLVRCHAGELNQVFLNLVVNAAQAMSGRAQRGTLAVTTRVDADHVVISISDTGCGIPDTIRERVFDAFFTTKDVGHGTGQGLGIARTIIVGRHDGSLTFDSKVGVGTTFHVRIPIAGVRPSPVGLVAVRSAASLPAARTA